MISLISRVRQRFLPTHNCIVEDGLAYDFYSQFIGPPDLALDIGANIGNRTRIFAALGSAVVAVEPQDACIRVLKRNFQRNPKVKLIKKAVGSSEGYSEIMVSNANTISSLSADWVQAVRDSGRFSSYRWERKQRVEITTLDNLIETFGAPAFVKIDVEGYEHEVLCGLSKPVRALSFEFTPEFLSATYQCVERLSSFGQVSFNYSLGESMKLALPDWVTKNEIRAILSGYKTDYELFGDVYARFASV